MEDDGWVIKLQIQTIMETCNIKSENNRRETGETNDYFQEGKELSNIHETVIETVKECKRGKDGWTDTTGFSILNVLFKL